LQLLNILRQFAKEVENNSNYSDSKNTDTEKETQNFASLLTEVVNEKNISPVLFTENRWKSPANTYKLLDIIQKLL